MGLLDVLDYIQGNRPNQLRREKMTRFDNFVNNELPALANSIHSAGTIEDVQRQAASFFAAGLKAGLNAQQLQKLSEHLVQPALNNLGAGEISKIAQQLQPQTAVTDRPTVAPKGLQAMMPETDLSLPFSVEQKPGRAFNQADAMKLAEVEARTGIKPPAGMAGLVVAPSAVGENEAQAAAASEMARLRQTQQSREQTQQAIEKMQQEELAKTEGEAGQVARATRGQGLRSYLGDVATRAQNAPRVEAQTATERARQAELGTRSLVNQATIPLRRAQTEKTLRVTEDGDGTETEQDRFVKPDEQMLAERAIAKTAVDRGVNKLPPEQQGPALAKIADDFGFDLEGDASLDAGSGGFLGLGKNAATLSGQYSLKPQAKRTTKSKGGAKSAGKPQASATSQGGGKELDAETAAAILKEAGGDKNKARQLAKQRGYSF